MLYRAAQLPIFEPWIDWFPIAELADAPLAVNSTLYVPPLQRRPSDPEMLARLRQTTGASQPSDCDQL